MRAKSFAAKASAGRMCIVLALVAGMASMAAADRAITRVDVANQPSRVLITVSGNHPLSMVGLSSPRGIYVGFQFDCRLAQKGSLVRVGSGRIWSVRYSNYRPSPPAMRVMVNTSSHLDYSTQWSGDRKSVQISVWKFGATPTARQSTKPGTPANPRYVVSGQICPGTGAANFGTWVSRSNKSVPSSKPRERMPQGSDPGIEVSPKLKPVSGSEVMARLAPAQPAEPAADSEKRVSLNFLAADINDVLKALSVQSGRNIVAGKDVTGSVTVSLADVSVEEALDYVAKLSGYSYTRDKDTYLVASKDSIGGLTGAAEPTQPQVEIVPIIYTDPTDVAGVLRAQFAAVQVSSASVQSDSQQTKTDKSAGPSRGSMLVLTGSPDDVARAKQLVKKLDESVRSEEGQKKAEVYRVKYVNPVDLAKALTRLVPGITVGPAPTDGFDLLAPSDIVEGTSGATVTAPTTSASPSQSSGGSESGGSEGGSDQGSGGWKFDKTKRTQAVIIVGREADVQKAVELATSLDLKSPQIKIDAKITSITESGEKKLGLNWNWGVFSVVEGSIAKSGKNGSTSGSTSGSTDNQYGGAAGPANADGHDTGTATSITGSIASAITGEVTNTVSAVLGDNKFYRQPWNFGAALDALITSGDGKVLASPSLLCLNGKPGVFFVGDEIQYIVSVQSTPSGQTVQTDKMKVGVQLRAVGEVSPDGYITLNLHPEVSVPTFNYDTTTKMTLPVKSSRFTDHTVRVKSGATIVIGGLIREDELDQMSKVPVLGDIPLFGQLFHHRHKTKDRSEVVMFITASVLED